MVSFVAIEKTAEIQKCAQHKEMPTCVPALRGQK